MLVAAQLYKEEVTRKLQATWYSLKYQYFWDGYGSDLDIPTDSYWKKQFVFLDEKGEVTGYFSYNYNSNTSSMNNFGLISFIDYNPKFILAIYEHIAAALKNGVKRIEFFAYEDNPANKGYQKLIKRFGGKQVGKLTNNTRLLDNKLHNTLIYEIINTEVE